MARLRAAQRRRLPRSAFVYAPKGAPRSSWKYPVPTKGQARKAGISERQRASIHRAAVSYSARRDTSGSIGRVKSVVTKRATKSYRPGSPARRAGSRGRASGGRMIRVAAPRRS
jgi:hypothetical protein